MRHSIFVFGTTLLWANGLSSSSSSSIPPREVRSVDCAIVGGAPAGLATAISLMKESPSTSLSVFEKDGFEPKGASIRISQRGWKALKRLDPALVPKLRETCVPVTGVESKPWKPSPSEPKAKKGLLKKVATKVSTLVLFGLMNMVMKGGVHLWHDIRITLRDHAVACFDEDGRTEQEVPFLNSNYELLGVEELLDADDEERFVLTFRDGSSGKETFRVRAKYLIACDGTKSKVREYLPREPDVLLDEQKSVWRGLAPEINVHGKATFYRGTQAEGETAGRSALIFPASKDAGASWTVISDLEDGKSSSIEDAKERALRVVRTMGEENNPDYDAMREVIEESNFVVESKLKVRDFEKPWETAYDGLLFLGDAAHPLRPTGEGMAMAFEDAVVLGGAASSTGKGSLSVETLRAYEQERLGPVKAVSDKVRQTAQNYYDSNNKNASPARDISDKP